MADTDSGHEKDYASGGAQKENKADNNNRWKHAKSNIDALWSQKGDQDRAIGRV